jgi:hypothetical protein
MLKAAKYRTLNIVLWMTIACRTVRHWKTTSRFSISAPGDACRGIRILYVLCFMFYVICDMWYAICYILHITYYVLHITYYILHITYYILHITYYILYITYYILHITCSHPVCGVGSGALATEQIYVHSKATIVDDDIAIVGSANLNNRYFFIPSFHITATATTFSPPVHHHRHVSNANIPPPHVINATDITSPPRVRHFHQVINFISSSPPPSPLSRHHHRHRFITTATNTSCLLPTPPSQRCYNTDSFEFFFLFFFIPQVRCEATETPNSP